ncbi:interleukin-17 receptor E isoform X2 [Betta splendens]|nr:interleukin-17 receptor E isoform X2 [Betta splendens]
MRRALAFLLVALSPLLLECKPTCQAANQSGLAEGLCPVKLSRVPSDCVTVRVWMTADELQKEPRVDVLSAINETFRPVRVKQPPPAAAARHRVERVSCSDPRSEPLWEFVYECVRAAADGAVSVSYSAASTRCTVSDLTPNFAVSVDAPSKSITVTVAPGRKVHVRLCFQGADSCSELPSQPFATVDPSSSPSVRLVAPYLPPCLCVEVYYTDLDASRRKKCVISAELTDAADVLRHARQELFESSLRWLSDCALKELPARPSASLCWRNARVCTPLPNSTLQESGGDDGDYNTLIFNTSAVDKHPQMCVVFSLQGSKNESCPFHSDMTSWEVSVGRGRQSLSVHVASEEPAGFSAQLCVLEETGCTATGPVHVLTEDAQVQVPPRLAGTPCVQVWQSRPALNGRRILCPDYTHHRWGLCAAAAVVVLVLVLLGVFFQRLTRTGAAGWLYIHTPVLLVCSSEHPAHVSAACALASVLQGELGARVHVSLWAQTSQRRAGPGVADLGPVPWLHGQWEAVRKAQGTVLIIWSPEAKDAYGAAAVEEGEDAGAGVDAGHEAGEKLLRCNEEEATGRKDWEAPGSTAVTGTVFAAALFRLQGALRRSKAPGVAIVYFQGLGHGGDIPRALRVPRYCLPQDFRGLIQELEGARSPLARRCWPRLLSKVLSIWLAQKLASRLQTLLPRSGLDPAEPEPAEPEPRPERPLAARRPSSQVP